MSDIVFIARNGLAGWEPIKGNGRAMKQTLSLIFAACLTLPLSAGEYHTLSNSNRTVAISAGALVEIVGYSAWDGANGCSIELTLANGDTTSSYIFGGLSNPTPPIRGQKFFSLTQVRIFSAAIPEQPILAAVTLKITPAAEIDSAGPKTVLVIPEGSTGDYDVVIESSGDMVTWTPMHSQTVAGSGPKTFFRTRIVKR
jgi:hypothetical protein